MRFLEIVIPLFLVLYFAWPLTGWVRRPAVGILPGFVIAVLFTHWQIEGARWQMYPLYALAVLTFFITLPSFLKHKGEEAGDAPSRKPLANLGLIALVGVLTLLPTLLPVPTVPGPRGPFSVGTRTYELVDSSRAELYSGKDEPRRFMIQVWYPAVPAPDAKPAPWIENADIITPALSSFIDMPPFFLEHLAYARSSAYADAPINPNQGPYPLLVFSHGWKGFRAQNTYQMQELVSHGYVAIAVDHTYGAQMVVFPNGDAAPNNDNAMPGGLPQDEYEIKARLLAEQWAGDIGYALDFMTERNARDPDGQFTNMLDLAKIGVLGHSTGGGATIQFCGTDARCQAAFLMDPFVRPVSPQVLENGLSQPSFHFFSQRWTDDRTSRNAELFGAFYQHIAPAPVVTILGTAHYDFSDLPALSPLAPQLGLKGPINGTRVQTIINDYTVAFFDQYLKGIPSPLMEGASDAYPELVWETIK
jgi:predicted dienelactone hydrolase